MDLIAERCPILIQMSTGVGLAVPFTEREALVEAAAAHGDPQSLHDDVWFR